jgi:hypothetical protein
MVPSIYITVAPNMSMDFVAATGEGSVAYDGEC